MNYILRESNDGKSFSLRPDSNGKIVRNKDNGTFDIGDEIKFIEGANTFGNKCKDVWICSDLSKLTEKGKELSKLYGLELKIRQTKSLLRNIKL